MNLGLHIIKNPVGTYHFVGNVPIYLSFERKNGDDISPFEADSLMSSNYPGMVKKRYGIQTKTWEKREDAIKEANELGYEVDD